MDFPSAEDAERFRVRLAQFKSRSDKGIGALLEDEDTSLSFVLQGRLPLSTEAELVSLPSSGVTVSISFKPKQERKKYSFILVEENEGDKS